MSLLEVKNLGVTFAGWRDAPPVEAVKGVSFNLEKGGDAGPGRRGRGRGKSVTALFVLQLLPYPSASHDSRQQRSNSPARS